MTKSLSTLNLIKISIFAILISSFGCKIYSVDAQNDQNYFEGIMPALSPDGTTIAFVSDRDGNRDLWIMNVNGSNPINITSALNDSWEFFPEWSPDNRHILFLSSSESLDNKKSDLWLASLDNRKLQRLTTDSSVGSAKWSPDGKSIVLDIFDGINNSSVWLMDSDGKNHRELITGGLYFSPKWSPDGKSIAYITQHELMLTDIETGKTRTLSTNDPYSYVWAARSHLIIYMTHKSYTDNISKADLWLIQIDPLHETQLNKDPIPLGDELAWSQDEEKILFRSACGDSVKIFDIWVLNLKEATLVNTTLCQQGFNGSANWFPNSEHVLFRSNRSGIPSIWVMSADGKETVDLIGTK